MRLKNFLILILPFSLLTLVFVFVKLTDQPSFRLDYLKCQKDIIYNSYGDVDYLIIGSSRTKQGIDPFQFSQILGKDDIVVNLSRSWRGNGNIYHLIREFTELHNIRKKIFIEYSDMEFSKKIGEKTSYNNGYYPNYNLVTDSNYLFDDFFFTPRDPFILRLRDLFYRYFDLIDKRVNYFFQHKRKSVLFKNPQNNMKKIKNHTCFTADNTYKFNLLKNIEEINKNNYKNNLNYWDISKINYDRHNLYIDELIKIANKKKFDLVLFNIPRIFDPMLSDELSKDIQKRFNLPFFYINNYSLLDQLYNIENYTDKTHMGSKGRLIYTKWLAENLEN